MIEPLTDPPIRALSDITLARWTLAGIGNSLKLGPSVEATDGLSDATGLQGSFFNSGLLQPILMIALLSGVVLVFTAIPIIVAGMVCHLVGMVVRSRDTRRRLRDRS